MQKKNQKKSKKNPKPRKGVVQGRVRKQEKGEKLHPYLRMWEVIAFFAIITSVTLFIVKEVTHLSPELLFVVSFFERAALAFLLFDLVYKFFSAKDKKYFLKNNWLLIIAYLPLGFLGSLARLIKMEEAVERVIPLTRLGSEVKLFLREVPIIGGILERTASRSALGFGLSVRDIWAGIIKFFRALLIK